MTAQMRRAAVAAVSNIAEAIGARVPERSRITLSITRGSVKELAAQVILAVRLGLTTGPEMEQLLAMCGSVYRMLHVLRSSLQQRQ